KKNKELNELTYNYVYKFIYTYAYKGKNKNGLEVIISHLKLPKFPKLPEGFIPAVKRKRNVTKSQGKMLFDNKAGRIQSNHVQYIHDSHNTDVISKKETYQYLLTVTRTLNLIKPEIKGKTTPN
ncbi:hypothetical protein MNBD_BACTEROID05-872, partial [hydrothermal vent metagenome]